MNRGASATIQTEWAKAANAPAHLVEIRFDTADGGTIYLTDSYRNITWNGNLYLANGDLIGFAGITESADLRVTDATFSFSGVDQALLALFLAKNWIDRRLLTYKCFFNTATEALLVDPIAIHDGRMDEPSLTEDGAGGTSTLVVHSRDQFADFERLSGRHTNDSEERLFFPNDAGFAMLSQIAGKQVSLQWGAASP